jgi:hypothetical protein
MPGAEGHSRQIPKPVRLSYAHRQSGQVPLLELCLTFAASINFGTGRRLARQGMPGVCLPIPPRKPLIMGCSDACTSLRRPLRITRFEAII